MLFSYFSRKTPESFNVLSEYGRSYFQSMETQSCCNFQYLHNLFRRCAIPYCISHVQLQSGLVEMRCSSIKSTVYQFLNLSFISKTFFFQLLLFEYRAYFWFQDSTFPCPSRRKFQIRIKELRIQSQEVFPSLMPIPSLLHELLL